MFGIIENRYLLVFCTFEERNSNLTHKLLALRFKDANFLCFYDVLLTLLCNVHSTQIWCMQAINMNSLHTDEIINLYCLRSKYGSNIVGVINRAQ